MTPDRAGATEEEMAECRVTGGDHTYVEGGARDHGRFHCSRCYVSLSPIWAVKAYRELRAAMRERDARIEKYYVKARVYGAIACAFREALEAIAKPGSMGVTIIAKEALAWRYSEKNGVPMSAVEATGKLLDAEAALERALSDLAEATARADAAEAKLVALGHHRQKRPRRASQGAPMTVKKRVCEPAPEKDACMTPKPKGMGMNLPCSACSDGTCDEHPSFKGFARLRRERDEALARVDAAERVVGAARGLREANDKALGEFRGRPDIAWRDVLMALDVYDADRKYSSNVRLQDDVETLTFDPAYEEAVASLKAHDDACRARGVCVLCEGKGILYAYRPKADSLVACLCHCAAKP